MGWTPWESIRDVAASVGETGVKLRVITGCDGYDGGRGGLYSGKR